MKDISASGFRLHAPMGAATELTLNTLVAIRRRDQEAWVLGIIRRMRRLSAQEAEIGLQLIANALANADLCEQRKVREADYSVNGESPAATGREFQGLFLSFNRREGEAPVQSLIVPAVEYPRVQALHAPDGGFATHDAVWARARTSCRLGVDRRRFPRAGWNRCGRVRTRRLSARAWRSIATARSLRRTAGTCPSNSTSRRPAARVGRPIARASRCTGRMRAGRVPRSPLGSAAGRESILQRPRRVGRRARRQDRAHPSAAARNRGRAHGRLPAGCRGGAAVLPVRSGSARIPAHRFRGEDRVRGPAIAAGSRVDPRTLPGWPTSSASRARARPGSRPTNGCSRRRRAVSRPWRPAPSMRHSSSTRAGPRDRRRAR